MSCDPSERYITLGLLEVATFMEECQEGRKAEFPASKARGSGSAPPYMHATSVMTTFQFYVLWKYGEGKFTQYHESVVVVDLEANC